jgi:hypothetical protein
MADKLKPSRREGRIGQCDPHDIFDHPAYGLVRMGVRTGGVPHLFGSDIEHKQRITISICHAELHRALSHDWVHSKGLPVVEIELSHSQFAEFITSPNSGEGIPCTITAVAGEGIPSIAKLESKSETFKREIEQAAKSRIEKALAKVGELGALIESGKHSKTALRDLHRELQREVAYLPSSIEHVVTQAEEAIDKATTAAKIDIEATMQHQLQRVGAHAVANRGDLLAHENDSGAIK